MTLLKILTAPDPRLKEKAVPVEKVDDDIRQLMDDMLETMYAAPGIGLAAPQVGVLKRVIVVDVADTKEGEEPNPIMLANPEIVKAAKEQSVYEEGCLSVPGFYEEVERPETCTVKGLNRDGEEVTIEAEGLLATCIQHEIDHLDGQLFIDYLSRLKRNMIVKKLSKEKKQQQAASDHNL